MPLDINFKNWLSKNNMWLKNGKTGKEHTHNVMEYGCFLSVKEEFKDKFIKKLSKTIDKGQINFLLEVRSDYFKFMVDVDFKSEFGLTSEEKLNLIKTIQTSVNSCINIEDNLLIVSSTKDEQIIYQDEEMVKIGMHLIWPNLIVGMNEARFLRSAIIQYLDLNIKSFSINNWEMIIDNSIYDNQHGLRMNSSNKNGVCPKCKNNKIKKEQCIKCNRTGWFDQVRVYKPTLVMNNEIIDNDILQILQNDTFKNLKTTSIRSNCNESNIEIDENKFPKWFSKDKYATHLYRGNKKQNKINPKLHPFQKYKPTEQNEISQDSIIYKALITYLKSQLYKISSEYEDIEFGKLKKITLKKNQFLYILATRHHFCLNMNRIHSSNHIYFQINGYNKLREIIQKCSSPYKNSNDIYCKDFKSIPIKLNDKIYNILFKFKEEEIKEEPRNKRIRKFSVD